MKREAGIFDKLQYLSGAAGYDDCRANCAIRFEGKKDRKALGRFFGLVTEALSP